MKRALPILIATAVTTLSFVELAQASTINGSFESAVFDGWRQELGRGYSSSQRRYLAAGSAAIAPTWQSAFGGSPLQAAIAGSNFAMLSTLANGNFMGNRTYHISLSQKISLDAGESITGWAAFFNGDFEAQDSAWVKILDSEGNLTANPWQQNSGCVPELHFNASPYHGVTPWTQWSWQAPASGVYTLSLGMTTTDDNNYASYGFFDDILIAPANLPVPEPTSLSLVAIGAAVVAAQRRMARK